MCASPDSLHLLQCQYAMLELVYQSYCNVRRSGNAANAGAVNQYCSAGSLSTVRSQIITSDYTYYRLDTTPSVRKRHYKYLLMDYFCCVFVSSILCVLRSMRFGHHIKLHISYTMMAQHHAPKQCVTSFSISAHTM